MAGWKNSAGTGNRGQDAPGEKGLGGTDKAPKEMGRRTETKKKKSKLKSPPIWFGALAAVTQRVLQAQYTEDIY